jgi:methionyl aminopeptidase
MIVRKTPAELEKMRRSGLLVWEILQKLASMVDEGITTHDLEVTAEKMMLDAGARPAFQRVLHAECGFEISIRALYFGE